MREGGGTVTRTMVLRRRRAGRSTCAGGRVAGATSVATRITSDVPIVASAHVLAFDPARGRSHNAFGVTETAYRWALAEGREAASSRSRLRAGRQPRPDRREPHGHVPADGGHSGDEDLLGRRRRAPDHHHWPGCWCGADNETFGTLVSSDQPVFVEHAVYSNANDVFWAAGSAATRRRSRARAVPPQEPAASTVLLSAGLPR